MSPEYGWRDNRRVKAGLYGCLDRRTWNETIAQCGVTTIVIWSLMSQGQTDVIKIGVERTQRRKQMRYEWARKY